jgi:DNA-binding LacI/PurR family transcriptional regulator
VLKRVDKRVAVLAVDSYVGWGVYEACRKLNLRIPEDVSVIGFDDVELTRALSPPLTVISQRTEEAQAGFELLNTRIQSGTPTVVGRKDLRQIVVDVDLIERGSVAGLPL